MAAHFRGPDLGDVLLMAPHVPNYVPTFIHTLQGPEMPCDMLLKFWHSALKRHIGSPMILPYGGESLSKYIRDNPTILAMVESPSHSLGREGKARAPGGSRIGLWAARLFALRRRNRRLLLSCGPLHPEKACHGPKGALDPINGLVTTSHPSAYVIRVKGRPVCWMCIGPMRPLSQETLYTFQTCARPLGVDAGNNALHRRIEYSSYAPAEAFCM